MSARFLAGLVSVVGSLGSLHIWAKDPQIQRVQYPTIESRSFVHNLPLPSEIEWIDDERVIFSGYEEGVEEALPNGNRVLKEGIYIFSTKTGKALRHADGELACFGRGRIRYVVRTFDGGNPRGKFTTYAGPLGTESEVPGFSRRTTIENRFSCTQYDRQKIPRVSGLPPYFLLEEHGYLELTFSAEKTWQDPVRFIRTDGRAISFPVKQIEMSSPKVKWYSQRGVYLIYDASPSEVNDRSEPKKPKRIGVPKRLFLLSPDGALEILEIPYHAWHRGLGRFYLTKRGVLMVTRGRASSAASYLEEVFLLRDDHWESILEAGGITNAAISADGCRAAMGVAKRRAMRPLLQVIDLCGQGRWK